LKAFFIFLSGFEKRVSQKKNFSNNNNNNNRLKAAKNDFFRTIVLNQKNRSFFGAVNSLTKRTTFYQK